MIMMFAQPRISRQEIESLSSTYITQEAATAPVSATKRRIRPAASLSFFLRVNNFLLLHLLLHILLILLLFLTIHR